MVKLKKVLAILLLLLTFTAFLTGCERPPKDQIEVRVITAKKTWHPDEQNTEVFMFVEILNGKKRDIKYFEAPAILKMHDGSTKETTLIFNKEVEYSRSMGVGYTWLIEGRVEDIELGQYTFYIKTFWQSFGGFILTVLVISIIVGILNLLFAMAEMNGVLSLIYAGLVILNVIIYIFSPFLEGFIITLGILLTLVPMAIYNITGGY